MTHITKVPSQAMFNSEGAWFINKYNTTIEVTVCLSAINDLPLSRTKEVKGGHLNQNRLTLQDPDWSALVDHL